MLHDLVIARASTGDFMGVLRGVSVSVEYLTCPCSECEVRITLRKFGTFHGSPRQPATKPCTTSSREAMTRSSSKCPVGGHRDIPEADDSFSCC